ncbi:MAG: hypothetical protein ACRD3M_03545 [Thermoanaerobaculia bacterium]
MILRRRILAALSGALLALSCRSAPQAPEPRPAPAPPAAETPAATQPAAPAPPPAAAIPPRPMPAASAGHPYLEVLELARSGASQEALLEKVRAGNVRYDLTTAEVLELRRAGVSEAVVEAMLRSGRR